MHLHHIALCLLLGGTALAAVQEPSIDLKIPAPADLNAWYDDLADRSKRDMRPEIFIEPTPEQLWDDAVSHGQPYPTLRFQARRVDVVTYLQKHPDLVSSLVEWAQSMDDREPLVYVDHTKPSETLTTALNTCPHSVLPPRLDGWTRIEWPQVLLPNGVIPIPPQYGIVTKEPQTGITMETPWPLNTDVWMHSGDIQHQLDYNAGIWDKITRNKAIRIEPVTAEELVINNPSALCLHAARTGALLRYKALYNYKGTQVMRPCTVDGIRVKQLGGAILTMRNELVFIDGMNGVLPDGWHVAITTESYGDLNRKAGATSGTSDVDQKHVAKSPNPGTKAWAMPTATTFQQWLDRQDEIIDALRKRYAATDEMTAQYEHLQQLRRKATVLAERSAIIDRAQELNASLERTNAEVGGPGADARNTVVRREMNAQAASIAGNADRLRKLDADITALALKRENQSKGLDEALAELAKVQTDIGQIDPDRVRLTPLPAPSAGITVADQRIEQHLAMDARQTRYRTEGVARGLLIPPTDPAAPGLQAIDAARAAAYTAEGLIDPSSAAGQRRLTEDAAFLKQVTAAAARIEPPFQAKRAAYVQAWATSPAGVQVRRDAFTGILRRLAQGIDTDGRHIDATADRCTRAAALLPTIATANLESAITSVLGYQEPQPGEPHLAVPPATPVDDPLAASSDAPREDPALRAKRIALERQPRSLLPLEGNPYQQLTLVMYTPMANRVKLIGYVDRDLHRIIPADPYLPPVAVRPLARTEIVSTSPVSATDIVSRIPLAFLPDEPRWRTYEVRLPEADAAGLVTSGGGYRCAGWYDAESGTLALGKQRRMVRVTPDAILSTQQPPAQPSGSAGLAAALASQDQALRAVATGCETALRARATVDTALDAWQTAFAAAEVADRWIRTWKLDATIQSAVAGNMVTVTYPDGRTVAFAVEKDNPAVRAAIAREEQAQRQRLADLAAKRQALAQAIDTFADAGKRLRSAMDTLSLVQDRLRANPAAEIAAWPSIPYTVGVPIIEQAKSVGTFTVTTRDMHGNIIPTPPGMGPSRPANGAVVTTARWNSRDDGIPVSDADLRTISVTKQILALDLDLAPPGYEMHDLPGLPPPARH